MKCLDRLQILAVFEPLPSKPKYKSLSPVFILLHYKHAYLELFLNRLVISKYSFSALDKLHVCTRIYDFMIIEKDFFQTPDETRQFDGYTFFSVRFFQTFLFRCVHPYGT